MWPRRVHYFSNNSTDWSQLFRLYYGYHTSIHRSDYIFQGIRPVFLLKSLLWVGLFLQIKSNHFYCHIITAHVPWWVKFLRACSIQCRKQLTYRQYHYILTDLYRWQCAIYTYILYTQYTQCTIRHTYSYQFTLYTVCTHSTLCTHIYTHS